MQEKTQPDNSEVALEDQVLTGLGKIYLPDPIIRFIARHPLWTALLIHVGGFWTLFLANWLNGSLVFSTPRKYDFTFCSTPFDWLYLGILLPGAFWALSHYYRSLYDGIKGLAAEGIISVSCLEVLLEEWKSRKLFRRSLKISFVIALLIYFLLVKTSFPTWCPEGRTTWFMNADHSPNYLGFLMLFLAMILTLLTFDYLCHTVRVARFHHLMIHSQSRPEVYSGLGFFPFHPDGAFGYGLLAPSMNWAGIIGLFVITILLVCTISIIAISEITGKLVIDHLLKMNLLLCFVFFPWVVFGPVYPLIKMLVQRKSLHLNSLRAKIAEKTSGQILNSENLDGLSKEWEIVAGGRPYIIEKKAIFFYAATIMITQLNVIFEALLKLTKFNLTLHF